MLSRGLLFTVLVTTLALSAGCVEKVVSSGRVRAPEPPPIGLPNPAKVPRIVTLSPSVGPESQSTEFFIEAVNLRAETPVEVTFGTQQWVGITNTDGTRILNVGSGNGAFTAPPGTGTVDLHVFITGQNPPTLEKSNAFVYLPPGSPALPKVLSMTPNQSDENGAQVISFAGQDVPLGYQIVVSWLFGSGDVSIVAAQQVADAWSCTIPAVPQSENFTTGTLQVTVVCSFSGGGLPVPIQVAVPPNFQQGNPFVYTHSGSSPPIEPEEFVIASGLYAPGTTGAIADSYRRTISAYNAAANDLAGNALPNQILENKFMREGARDFGPNGTHNYPSPLMNSGASWRDANSSFAHFALPQFDRTFVPAVAQGQPTPAPVTRPVTAHLYHATNAETTAAPTGTEDLLFAVYSNGEVEAFNVGQANIWEEIHIHQDFESNPFFAVALDSQTPRLFIGRLDGRPFTGSGRSVLEVNCTAVTGRIQGLSLAMAGRWIYFSTTDGNVWRSALDTTVALLPPMAAACSWPISGAHNVVSDQMSISGDGTTICFIAGTGTQRWNTFTQSPTPPSTQDVFAIRNAHQGATTIVPVTDFANAGTGGPKQIVFWNLGDSATSTYGVTNLDGGRTNSRRVRLAGVNNLTGSNLTGSDVTVNFSGTMCAFICRENRASVDPPNSDAVVNFLYVARIDQTNACLRLNAATLNSFGIGDFFHRDMAVVPGFWFPQRIPNSGMDRRLVFTVSGPSGGVSGAEQHLFTADFNLSGAGLSMSVLYNRTDSTLPIPYQVTAAVPSYNYFGCFPSRSGQVLFLFEQVTGQLLFLDLRDGVSSEVEPLLRAHNGLPFVLPVYDTSAPTLENTYLPNGFASNPAGNSDLEHWGAQIRSLQGPGLSPFSLEYLLLVGQENPGEEDVYIVQMSGLANPLPSEAINITNIPGQGVIRLVSPSKDGGVLAVVKGLQGFPNGYGFSGTVDGKLYIVNDLVSALIDNNGALTRSATGLIMPGTKFSRSMRWYQDTRRYSLYFGEGSAVAPPPPGLPRSLLRFTRLDLDRINNNAIGVPETIKPGGNALQDGAVYIYDVGKRE